ASNRILVIAQPELQRFAFNLLLDNGEFVGASRAIGLAPSLTWFSAARERQATAFSTRRAWISSSDAAAEFGPTLDLLSARLAPIFAAHGFIVNTSSEIPKELAGASVAVISAHGQLTAEREYIHRISDEQGLKVSPTALAQAVTGAELVILFVCSGGRVD